MLSRILVAVDGSPYSLRAALLGANILNREIPATLTLIYVAKAAADLDWFHFQGPLSDLNQAGAEERSALEQAFQKGQEIMKDARSACVDLLKDRPVQVESVVHFGDPAEQIIDFSKKKEFDLIVLGCRGVGPLRGVILGSVSQKVLHGARAPVLIVK